MGRDRIEFPQVHTADVDGIAAFWAPMEGPVTAVLHFDGGICTEAPHERGIQHLIEHVVLKEVGAQAYDYNGYVDMRRVAFSIRGEPQEVRDFFQVVSAGLASIPQTHSHEAGVLQAEAARNSGSTLTSLLSYTFGTEGPGAAAVPELGLGLFDADHLSAWIASRMSRPRAALFCSRDPSFLDLSGITDGDRGAVWQLPASIDGPGWTFGNGSGFASVAVLPRSTANATMVRTLRDHCLDHVRHQHGVSYNVDTMYEPLTPDDVLVGLFVDAAPERRVTARNTLLNALDVFATSGPDQRWLELDAERMERTVREQGAGLARAARAAAEVCLGGDDALAEEWVEDYLQLTPADLASAAAEFLAIASWQMPAEAPMPPWRGMPRLRQYSLSAIEGRELVPAAPLEFRVVAGPDGVSMVFGPDRVGTVRFEDVVATEAWDDGARLIYGRDGVRLRFIPKDWAEGPEFLDWLDRSLARAPLIRRPPGSPS